MGYTNGVVALSTGIPVNLIWIHEILGTNEALVVPDSRDVKDIKDLKGKKLPHLLAQPLILVYYNL